MDKLEESERFVKPIHPSLFNELMQFPDGIRRELLEFLGATPVVDEQLREMIADIFARLESEKGDTVN